MNETNEESKGTKELKKLHSMLRDLEEDNDLLPGATSDDNQHLKDFCDSQDSLVVSSDLKNNNTVDGNRHLQSDSRVLKAENSLFFVREEIDLATFEDDITIEDENSWLLKTPSSIKKAETRPKAWLTDNMRTPELNRVKGSLASKIDLILIQTRKEKLNNLLAKHNLGSHPDSAPGRLYQAESMCSVMSMDWEYDDDHLLFAYSQNGRPQTAQQTNQMTDFDEIDFGVNNHSRPMVAFSDSPIRRAGRSYEYLEESHFDDLQPMTLNFDSPPVGQRSVQVAPGPVITRRSGGIQGNGIKPRQMKMSNFKSSDPGVNNKTRRPSFSDRSDSSGDFPSSPRSSLGSSRNSLDSPEDAATRKGKAPGRRILLPITTFFDGPIPEEDLDSDYDRSSRILNPYAAWDVMRGDHRIQASHSALNPVASPNQVDPTLTVKLPQSSSDGPVIRRRGANANVSPVSMSVDAIPRPKLSNQGVVIRGKDQKSSSSQSQSNMPRPRTAQPSSRKSLLPSQKRLPQKYDLNQSPDIVPRKERSPDRRSQSPDLIPRKSGIVRRGQGINRSYQM